MHAAGQRMQKFFEKGIKCINIIVGLMLTDPCTFGDAKNVGKRCYRTDVVNLSSEFLMQLVWTLKMLASEFSLPRLKHNIVSKQNSMTSRRTETVSQEMSLSLVEIVFSL